MQDTSRQNTTPQSTRANPIVAQSAFFEARAESIVTSRPDLTRQLSPAQVAVLRFLLAGYSEPEVAEKLNRSRHTVHDHTKAIYAALKVETRVQLLLLFAAPPSAVLPAAH